MLRVTGYELRVNHIFLNFIIHRSNGLLVTGYWLLVSSLFAHSEICSFPGEIFSYLKFHRASVAFHVSSFCLFTSSPHLLISSSPYLFVFVSQSNRNSSSLCLSIIRTLYFSFKYRINFSAAYTERCLPPVHPKLIIRCVNPLSR